MSLALGLLLPLSTATAVTAESCLRHGAPSTKSEIIQRVDRVPTFSVVNAQCVTAVAAAKRLRGGGLSKDEIIQKLNRVPTFSVVNAEGQVVPMRGEDGEADDVCWFTNAAEARELLALTSAAYPEAELRLAVSPLGVVFGLCKGWPPGEADEEETEDEGSTYTGGKLKLRAPRAVLEATGAGLREQLEAQGLEPGDWQMPIYCSDDFQTEAMMPLFFSQDDFAAGWRRAGKPEPPPENLAVMDLRALVKQMRDTDVFDWKIFTFVSSEEAYALAQELQERTKAQDEGLE